MNYNKRNISQFKGRLVFLEYNHQKDNKSYQNKLTRIITANTSSHILFQVNKSEPEISLKYSQIDNINIPEKWETT